jgi:hypothetical protein
MCLIQVVTCRKVYVSDICNSDKNKNKNQKIGYFFRKNGWKQKKILHLFNIGADRLVIQQFSKCGGRGGGHMLTAIVQTFQPCVLPPPPPP